MRKHVTYSQTFKREGGEEVELEAQYEPCDYHDPILKEAGDYIIFGYLSPDGDCSNPLEDCDGYGEIHHHPRSRYGKRNTDYFEILGLDTEGEKDLESVYVHHEKEARGRYIEAVLRDEDQQELLAWAEDNYERVEEDEANSNTVFMRNCLREDPDDSWWNSCQYWQTMDKVLEDMWGEDKFFPGNPDAVLLDLYDHSGQIWSISGGGTQCRWDTSRGESVWIPDESARDEIDRRAPVYDHAWVENTSWVRGTGKQYLLHFGDKEGVFSDDWWELYKKAEEIAKEAIADGRAPIANGRLKARLEICRQALDQYNAWSSGDCYDVIVQVHEKDGTYLESHDCWGYVGGDYAQETLREEVEHAVNVWEKKAPQADPNQMEIAL